MGVLGGSVGRTGAARMAADAALRAGAGLVSIATASEALPALAGGLYEVMGEAIDARVPPADAARRLNARDAVVIGPGISVDAATGGWLAELLPRLTVPVVIDADGLNHLAAWPEVWREAPPRVLTPHPGEAARLLGTTTAAVQADRIGAVAALVERTGGVVVLKGAHTWVGAPDGTRCVCPAGNPGMASAGMGDVLSGIIGALLARGLEPAQAAAAAVLWHARAGDLVAARGTENALVAGDVIGALAAVERGERCSGD